MDARSLRPVAPFPVGFARMIEISDTVAADMSRHGTLEIYAHDSASDVTTLSDEVAEVFPGHITFALELDLLLAFVEQLLNATLKALAKLVRRELECPPDL